MFNKDHLSTEMVISNLRVILKELLFRQGDQTVDTAEIMSKLSKMKGSLGILEIKRISEQQVHSNSQDSKNKSHSILKMAQNFRTQAVTTHYQPTHYSGTIPRNSCSCRIAQTAIITDCQNSVN